MFTPKVGVEVISLHPLHLTFMLLLNLTDTIIIVLKKNGNFKSIRKNIIF